MPKNKERLSRVQIAAGIYGCEVQDLLSYRKYEDGSVAIIAPSGQKFIYSAERLMQAMAKQTQFKPPEPTPPPDPEPKTTAKKDKQA